MTTQDEETQEQPPGPSGEKLQKVLANAGKGSRRQMEALIASGAVRVNDRVASVGDRVEPHDRISIHGKKLHLADANLPSRRVLLFNKPEGLICSRNDPEGRPTVYDSLPQIKNGRWISVGRLDINTSGLLLFTNDGELANKLMHPSSNIDREYLVRVKGEVSDDIIKTLTAGVELEDGPARFTDVRVGNQEGSNKWFYCALMEGRNREVRRLWESQGFQVSRLKRVRYGNIFVPSHVRSGQWVELNDKEIKDLFLTAGMDAPRGRRTVKHDEKMYKERHEKRLRSGRSSHKDRSTRPSARRPKKK